MLVTSAVELEGETSVGQRWSPVSATATAPGMGWRMLQRMQPGLGPCGASKSGFLDTGRLTDVLG